MNWQMKFSNFRYAVDDTDLLQGWYHFRDDWYKDKAEKWMEDNDVDFKDWHITSKNPEVYIRDVPDDWDDDKL